MNLDGMLQMNLGHRSVISGAKRSLIDCAGRSPRRLASRSIYHEALVEEWKNGDDDVGFYGTEIVTCAIHVCLVRRANEGGKWTHEEHNEEETILLPSDHLPFHQLLESFSLVAINFFSFTRFVAPLLLLVVGTSAPVYFLHFLHFLHTRSTQGHRCWMHHPRMLNLFNQVDSRLCSKSITTALEGLSRLSQLPPPSNNSTGIKRFLPCSFVFFRMNGTLG